MIKILAQIFRTGIVTDKSPQFDDPKIKVSGIKLDESVKKCFRRSLSVRHVDAGSCNGCELEIHAINNPVYNCERLGIHFTASPRFADVLLVTGPVTKNMEIALRRTYDAVASPKIVIAVGDCGCNGGIFGETYASLGGIDKVIPVNVFIPGCPPTPADILNGFYKIFL
jgi:Ni,Fe-hydrogenase III small subunit